MMNISPRLRASIIELVCLMIYFIFLYAIASRYWPQSPLDRAGPDSIYNREHSR